MNTLIINDLEHSQELDTTALAAVVGGCGFCMPACCTPGSYSQPGSYGQPAPYGQSKSYGAPTTNLTFDVSQSLSQSQNTINNNGNNVAYASGITSTVTPTQTGSNNITFG